MHQYSVDSTTNLSEILDVVEQGDSIEIVRSGTRVAVLISSEEYDRLTASQPDFWHALQAFRQNFKLEEEGTISEDFEGLRDSSTGREVNV